MSTETIEVDEGSPQVETPEHRPVILADPELIEPLPGHRWILDDDMFHKVPVKVKIKVSKNPDRFETVEEERVWPHYSVKETAKFFFGKSPHWLRWRYLSDERTSKVTGEVTKAAKHPDGFFVLDGEPLVPKTSISGYRYYTLPDIERMAAALGQQKVIDGWEVNAITLLAVSNAAIWGVGPRSGK
jgi:hypothetical protein